MSLLLPVGGVSVIVVSSSGHSGIFGFVNGATPIFVTLASFTIPFSSSCSDASIACAVYLIDSLCPGFNSVFSSS